MKVEKQTSFKGISPYIITSGLEDKVFLNKALFDVTGSDAPWVIMANNKEERRERLNRALLSFSLIFVSPLIVLPFANRFAMRYVAKLTPELFSKEYNAIRLPNKNLLDEAGTREGLKNLSKDLKIDFNKIENKVNGDYDVLRKKIINAKNTVLGIDFSLVTGSFGSIGFFNNQQTKKKTGQDGYSAELEMADKEIVEKRAAKYKKTSRIKFALFLTSLATIVIAVPLSIKHGLSAKNASKFTNFIQKHAEKFDYNDAIFMKRLPLAIALFGAHIGINLASRNTTELKDNSIRSSTSFAIFFGGDILMSSLLGRLSDKLFKTKLIKKNANKSFLNKILPPIHSLKELNKINDVKSRNIAIGLFWINLASLSALMGFATPYLINKIIKKDVSEDIKKSQK